MASSGGANVGVEHELSNQTTSEDPMLVAFDDEDVEEGVEEYETSLIRKLLMSKLISKRSLQQALLNIWGNHPGFKVEETLGACSSVFPGEQTPGEGVEGLTMDFAELLVTVTKLVSGTSASPTGFLEDPGLDSVLGFGPSLSDEEDGREAGVMMGAVKDSGVFEMPDSLGTVVKALMEMEVSKPLMRGVNAGSKRDDIFWVDFRYERLPQFYYVLGGGARGGRVQRTEWGGSGGEWHKGVACQNHLKVALLFC